MTTNRAFEIRSDTTICHANYDGGCVFAIFSAHAERVELSAPTIRSGEHEIARLIPEYTDEIWHGYVPKLQPGARCMGTAFTVLPDPEKWSSF